MQVEVDELGAGEALAAFDELRAVRDRAERDIFVLAAHLADLYNVDADAAGGLRSLPGGQRALPLGGEGGPLVLEFAIAEVAVALHMSTLSARRLIGDALTTRDRLPRLWRRILDGEVPPWRARKVLRATAELSRAQAAVVDDQVADYADGRLAYGRFMDKLAAEVIAADPDGAAARERARAAERFAKVGQSNDHGQKTLYVKTSAAEMTRIEASIAYLADALRVLGDPDDEDRRRTKAVLLLANPAQALALMQALATARSHGASAPCSETPPPGDAGDHLSSAYSGGHPPSADPGGHPPSADATDVAGGMEPGGRDSGGTDSGGGFCSDQPAEPLPDDPLDLGSHLEPGPGSEASGGQDPGSCGRDPGSCGRDPGSGGHEPGSGVWDRFSTPFRPDRVPLCPCRGGRYTYDPATLLPTVQLYIHVHADTIKAGNGVARWEGEGPISAAYVRDFLGPHARFVIKPVIDPATMPAVDAYEIPERLREAVHLRTPFDVFPFAANTGRGMQTDHTIAYRRRDRGGGPGQTGMDNLGDMIGFHHRVKTHAGWQLKQPFPGIYLWMTPHGGVYLVDNTGTRQVRGPRPPRHADGLGACSQDGAAPAAEESPPTARFARLIDEWAA